MNDIYDRVAERMAMAIITDADVYAYRIMAKNRVRVVSGGQEPTIEHYRLALEKCIEEKAADWRAACEATAAASKAVGDLKDEIARLRLTVAEREAVQWAACEADEYEEDEPIPHQRADALRGLLARLGGER